MWRDGQAAVSSTRRAAELVASASRQVALPCPRECPGARRTSPLAVQCSAVAILPGAQDKAHVQWSQHAQHGCTGVDHRWLTWRRRLCTAGALVYRGSYVNVRVDDSGVRFGLDGKLFPTAIPLPQQQASSVYLVVNLCGGTRAVIVRAVWGGACGARVSVCAPSYMCVPGVCVDPAGDAAVAWRKSSSASSATASEPCLSCSQAPCPRPW